MEQNIEYGVEEKSLICETTMERKTEIKLLIDCLNGNIESYREIVMLYQHAVYATAFYYVKNTEKAKEIAQEAFISAFRHLDQIKDLSKFGVWLKEITTRLSLNYLNKEKEITPYEEDTIIRFEREKEIVNLPNLTFVDIKTAIEQLPERYRLPVVLKFLEGMNYDEISRFTGESPNEVKGILQRAIKQLRTILQSTKEEKEKQWRDVIK